MGLMLVQMTQLVQKEVVFHQSAPSWASVLDTPLTEVRKNVLDKLSSGPVQIYLHKRHFYADYNQIAS